MNRKKLGSQAESLAKNYLQNKGYKFITQNFRTNFGEIDLIFVDQDATVFVEVKARHSVDQGLPEEAVTPQKLRTISKVGEHFLHKYPHLPPRARIDVVALELTGSDPVIRHLQNVTG